MTRLFSIVLAALALSARCETAELKSPDGRLEVGFTADLEGMTWSLKRDGKMLIAPSAIGLSFCDSGPLVKMKIISRNEVSNDSNWETTLYRRGKVRDHFNELTLELEEIGEAKVPRRLGLVFRAYDEGVAYRYLVPEQPAFYGFVLENELGEWRFGGTNEAWVTEYKIENQSQEAKFIRKNLAKVKSDSFIGMPVVVELDGSSLALCEAALSNWAGLYYLADGVGGLKAHLSKLRCSDPTPKDAAVICGTPAKSPWRVAIVGDDGIDLLRKNDIIVNLNPPPEEGLDFSWVKPGASSWDWWVESNNSLSTELTLKLVDFAAEMGWSYHTIDGGWYGFARRPNHGPNVRLRPRRGFDLEKIIGHATEKGVGIWVWIHWELIRDNGIEETFAQLEKWGVKGVKTDFIDRQDQWMVNWCEKLCRVAAAHRIMVNLHGSFKSTGTERTWPNNITREAILGNEHNIFSPCIRPSHVLTLPFTRFLLGPADFTPGAFANVYMKDFKAQVKKGHRYGDETDRCEHWAEAMGTRAFAIAECIAFDSPLMTLCDWPERYRGADGIEALRSLPASWKATTPLEGRCGEYYAVLRETHDGRFYYAVMTAERRNVELKLDFLGEGDWRMRIFADDPELTPADAKEIALGERKVRRGEKIGFFLRGEGGAVAIFERIGEK